MMYDKNKVKRYHKKLVNKNRDLAHSYSQDESFKAYEMFLNDFVESGTEILPMDVDFGETELTRVDYPYTKIFNWYTWNYNAQSVLIFEAENDYVRLLNACIHELLYPVMYIKAPQYAYPDMPIPPNFLANDLSLMLMFSLTYCPEYSELIHHHLLLWIEHEDKKDKSGHFKTKDYGMTNILPLSAFLARQHKKEAIADSIEEIIQRCCIANIEPCYANTLKTIFSENEDDVKLVVEELMQFHIKNSNDNNYLLAFYKNTWQYFPIEIISLLELRLKKGLSIEFIDDPLLNIFKPHLGIALPIPRDPLLDKIEKHIFSKNR